jgi:hypothetical protein
MNDPFATPNRTSARPSVAEFDTKTEEGTDHESRSNVEDESGIESEMRDDQLEMNHDGSEK